MQEMETEQRIERMESDEDVIIPLSYTTSCTRSLLTITRTDTLATGKAQWLTQLWSKAQSQTTGHGYGAARWTMEKLTPILQEFGLMVGTQQSKEATDLIDWYAHNPMNTCHVATEAPAYYSGHNHTEDVLQLAIESGLQVCVGDGSSMPIKNRRLKAGAAYVRLDKKGQSMQMRLPNTHEQTINRAKGDGVIMALANTDPMIELMYAVDSQLWLTITTQGGWSWLDGACVMHVLPKTRLSEHACQTRVYLNARVKHVFI